MMNRQISIAVIAVAFLAAGCSPPAAKTQPSASSASESSKLPPSAPPVAPPGPSETAKSLAECIGVYATLAGVDPTAMPPADGAKGDSTRAAQIAAMQSLIGKLQMEKGFQGPAAGVAGKEAAVKIAAQPLTQTQSMAETCRDVYR